MTKQESFVDQALHTAEGREALARAICEPNRAICEPICVVEGLSETEVWSNDAYAYDWGWGER